MERAYNISLNGTNPPAEQYPPRGFDPTAHALAAACDELEETSTRAVAHEVATGGWNVEVLQPNGQPARPYFHIPPTESGEFGPASAGHRLIEHGWMPRSCAHFAPDRAAGWKADPNAPGTWTAPVIPTEESTS